MSTFEEYGAFYDLIEWVFELQTNKANSSETEAQFLDLHLTFLNRFISCKIYYKRDDFDFEIVNFPYLDGDVSQRIRFARVSSHVSDFNTRNKLLTAKRLNQGYRYHELRKVFSKFYRRHFHLVSKFSVRLKSLLQQGLSKPEFYGDLVYMFRQIYARNDLSTQFRKMSLRYIKIGYNINLIRQSRLITLLPSLVARRRVGPQTLWRLQA